MKISVVTPAHNEERFIARCAESVRLSAEHCCNEFREIQFEHIVVLNRCSDETEAVAIDCGCKVVSESTRNLSAIRNTGAKIATGEVIVTIDADSWMSVTMLSEVIKELEKGKVIGGGVKVLPERWSVGIVCSLMVVIPFIIWHRVKSAGMFWLYKEDFDAIGGFDETLVCVEDVDFAQRLRKYGRRKGKRYGTIRKANITTSCRKFDQFGDWYFVKNPKVVFDIFKRKQAAADDFYYESRKTED